MAMLGIYGPHAVGKTMATDRLMSELDGTGMPVVVVNCDNNRQQYWDGDTVVEVRYAGRGMWKGTAVRKRELVRDCIADDYTLYVIESGRFDVHSGIADAFVECRGGAHVLFTTCAPDTFRQFLIDRNKANNRTFNSTYWTESKLLYEGCARFVNQAHKYLDPAKVPYDVLDVDYDRSAWIDIDNLIWNLVTSIVPLLETK